MSNVTLRDWLQFAPTMLSLFLTAIGLYMSYLQGKENISEAEMQRYVDRAIAQALSQFEPAEVGSLAQEPAKQVSEVGKTYSQKKPTAENRKMRRAQNAKDRKKATGQK